MKLKGQVLTMHLIVYLCMFVDIQILFSWLDVDPWSCKATQASSRLVYSSKVSLCTNVLVDIWYDNAGDVNLDGYPDLLIITKNVSSSNTLPQAMLVLNQPCQGSCVQSDTKLRELEPLLDVNVRYSQRY